MLEITAVGFIERVKAKKSTGEQRKPKTKQKTKKPRWQVQMSGYLNVTREFNDR